MMKLLYRILGLYLNLLSAIAPAAAAQQGWKLFCYPPRIPLKARHRAFLDTGVYKTMNVAGNQVQLYKWGSGSKKILFLHGWQSHTYYWKDYIESMAAEDCTLYSIDAPGHGYSAGHMLHLPLYSQVIEDFISSYGSIDTAVCHSFGGFALGHSIYNNSSLPVGKMILMGVPGQVTDFAALFKSRLHLREKTMNLIVDLSKEKFHKSLDNFNMEKFSTKFSQEGIIVHEKKDKEAPYKYAVAMSHAWQRSRLITTEGLDHKLRSPEIVKLVINYVFEKENTKTESY